MFLLRINEITNYTQIVLFAFCYQIKCFFSIVFYFLRLSADMCNSLTVAKYIFLIKAVSARIKIS